MRKRNNLTDEEKKEIELWKYRRKKYKIKVPTIAFWYGYHPQYLYAIENYVYPMNDNIRAIYKKAIKTAERRVRHRVAYEKAEEKQ